MSTNGCTHGMHRQLVAWIRFPQRPAIVNVLLKQGVRKARVAQGNRHGEVDTAARLDLLVEQIAAVLGATRTGDDASEAAIQAL